MTLKEISEKAWQLKTLILDLMMQYVEPATLEAFHSSCQESNPYYQIEEHDIPTFRDLKAFLNILTSITQVTNKLTQEKDFVKKCSIAQDIFYFKNNYQIYMATNNILSHYLKIAKTKFLNDYFPLIKENFFELILLFNEKNLEKIKDFTMEQLLSLEKYQDNYRRLLYKKTLGEVEIEVDKTKEENFVSLLARKNDYFLRKYCENKYDLWFKSPGESEHKLDEKQTDISDFYPENKNDSDTIKNFKLVLNGIIGIKKVLDEHSSYQHSSVLTSVVYLTRLIYNLKIAYNCFSQFDYQAIIAELSGPSTEKIKVFIKSWNEYFEKLFCVLDQFESEFRLKEGTLLFFARQVLMVYNDIVTQFSIPVDFIKQKNNFYKSRYLKNKEIVRNMYAQQCQLNRFLYYKHYPLLELSDPIRKEMTAYILQYFDEICMDKSKLSLYQEYLDEKPAPADDWVDLFFNKIEWFGNYAGLTLHAGIMDVFKKRFLYLEKQQSFLEGKIKKFEHYSSEYPYLFFEKKKLKENNYQEILLDSLKGRFEEVSIAYLKFIKTVSLDAVEVLKAGLEDDMLGKVFEEQVKKLSRIENQSILKDFSVFKNKPTLQWMNQLKIKTKEYILLDESIKKYEEKKDWAVFNNLLAKEITLSVKSKLLLNDVNEVLKYYQPSLSTGSTG